MTIEENDLRLAPDCVSVICSVQRSFEQSVEQFMMEHVKGGSRPLSPLSPKVSHMAMQLVNLQLKMNDKNHSNY